MHYVNTLGKQERSAEDPEDLQVFVGISQRVLWSNETLARPTSCFALDLAAKAREGAYARESSCKTR